MGQVNAIVLFFLLFSYYLDDRKNSIAAGIAFGIAILLKPIFCFFLLFFILKRSRKLVLTSLITITSAFLLTLLFWGVPPWFDWLKIGILPLGNIAGRESYYNQGLMGFISRLGASIEVRKYLSGFLSILLVVYAFLLAIKKDAKSLVLSLFILTLLIIDTTSWQHHFVWLIFPFVILSDIAINARKKVVLILIFIAYLLAAWNFKNPLLFENFPKVLLLSNQFYAAVILLGINLYFLKKHDQGRERKQKI